MLHWSVQDAEARFSELLEVCIQEKAQILSQHGQEVAVLVSIKEWRRLQNQAQPSLKQWLQMDYARTDNLTVERPTQQNVTRREVLTFE